MPDRPVVVLGAGGHARVVADALLAAGRQVLGYVDADPKLWGKQFLGLPVLGGDDRLADLASRGIGLANGIGSVREPHARRGLFERCRQQGFSFETLVHPSACVSAFAELAEGAQVMARAVVQAGSRIGCNAIVNTGAVVDHDCVIGEHVHIAPGATLSGGVIIGDNCHVGTGGVVIQGITLGTGCVVGAGAVVTRDQPGGALLVGVPARLKSIL